ncbi:UPF0481 protein At3g47200-like [Rhodamnia argentea]|uniref:UPF0481 protein At3g47200-like n=1 Tax=Rhodamnia argentea TaxID=178133 RepID=A0A8B8NPI5_9MYRT|nr:UPF0481 protein At3g47200-like [Rhodamnia argentea]
MSVDSHETDWIVQVNESLKPLPSREQQLWEKRSIYRIPTHVANLNPKAYLPQVVSFGPYHHGDDHLLPMEEHKRRALSRFLERTGKPLEPFLKSLREVARDLEESYDALDPKWKVGGSQGSAGPFLDLMIIDGCFLLEILMFATGREKGYAHNDPIFSNYGMVYIMQHIRRDMLMLENQLPMLVLYRLYAVECDGKQGIEFINGLVFEFFLIFEFFGSYNFFVHGLDERLHVLEVYRKSLQLHEDRSKEPQLEEMWQWSSKVIIPSATELKYAGIRFETSYTNNLRDISFASGTLRLPMIVVDATSESVLLNLIAFERFHIGAGYEVTSYISLMAQIITDKRDVELLRTQGIIQHAIGSDEAVAELFHSLSKDVALDPGSSLKAVKGPLDEYCKKRWIMWKANIVRTYFSNPWSILSLIAAVFALALTIIQTVYSALSYNPNPHFASGK